ncbi:hypothetical protein B484DRAFT_104982 [Ochromonadaceae sp. CCMP2298]|nr:hypothetical protein B484DRAFT_104982 [Ochromonadaceae sp. CCMP2298]
MRIYTPPPALSTNIYIINTTHIHIHYTYTKHYLHINTYIHYMIYTQIQPGGGDPGADQLDRGPQGVHEGDPLFPYSPNPIFPYSHIPIFPYSPIPLFPYSPNPTILLSS